MNGETSSLAVRRERNPAARCLLALVLGLAALSPSFAALPRVVPDPLLDDGFESGAACGIWGSVLTPEVCNGLDDDCNFSIDEGDPGGGGSCNTGLPGVCAAGVVHCTNAALACAQSQQALPEICNGLDDDCDGIPDDGSPGAGAACNTGLLGVCAPGTTACANGNLTCTQNVFASAEICNGLDDDCDGIADDGNPGGGAACNTGLLGVCAPGTTLCTNGSFTCAQNVFASAEICNGLDDDCDGIADDGNPGGGSACNTGLLGVCAPGTTLCTNGSFTCAQNVFASAEICNGLDDNCNGVVDDGVTPPPNLCSTLGVCNGQSIPKVCLGASGWKCNYSLVPNVEIDLNGNLLASELRCDGRDGNCNGTVDLDGFPLLGSTCAPGSIWACNGAQNGLVCVAP